MSKVSFYLIENKPLRQTELACRLSQQILNKHRLWWHCQDEAQCAQLDDFLWGFEATSFIPHGINQIEQPICLSTQLPHVSFDVCINFSNTAIDIEKLPHADLHIIEIVANDEASKQQSRDVFKQYRQLGLDPVIHRI